jgi:uncharacterized protein (DUF1810 family)
MEWMAEAGTLERFLVAQAAVYAEALAELRAGQKRSHWMWYVFPQLKGLGHSSTAAYYGIASRSEALAYFEHAVLGARLKECTQAVLGHAGKTAYEIFGTPDDLKLRSSVTLFAAVASQEPVFELTLQCFFGGAPDPKTLQLLDP